MPSPGTTPLAPDLGEPPSRRKPRWVSVALSQPSSYFSGCTRSDATSSSPCSLIMGDYSPNPFLTTGMIKCRNQDLNPGGWVPGSVLLNQYAMLPMVPCGSHFWETKSPSPTNGIHSCAPALANLLGKEASSVYRTEHPLPTPGIWAVLAAWDALHPLPPFLILHVF